MRESLNWTEKTCGDQQGAKVWSGKRRLFLWAPSCCGASVERDSQGAKLAGLSFEKMVRRSYKDLTLLLHLPTTRSPCRVRGCLEKDGSQSGGNTALLEVYTYSRAAWEGQRPWWWLEISAKPVWSFLGQSNCTFWAWRLFSPAAFQKAAAVSGSADAGDLLLRSIFHNREW